MEGNARLHMTTKANNTTQRDLKLQSSMLK